MELFMSNVFFFTDVISILIVYEANLMFKPTARLATLKLHLKQLHLCVEKMPCNSVC